MANITKIKTDVINELKNTVYYNQVEIERVVSNPALYSHKEIVDRLVGLLKANVTASASMELMEQYFPTQKAASVEEPQQETPVEEVN